MNVNEIKVLFFRFLTKRIGGSARGRVYSQYKTDKLILVYVVDVKETL